MALFADMLRLITAAIVSLFLLSGMYKLECWVLCNFLVAFDFEMTSRW